MNTLFRSALIGLILLAASAFGQTSGLPCPGANNQVGTPLLVWNGQDLLGCSAASSLWTGVVENKAINYGPSTTAGLQEAVNAAASAGGTKVIIDQAWTRAGGTNATIASITPAWNVTIEDRRGINGEQPVFWTIQPTTLTQLAAPTTLTSTTATFGGTGTWSTSTYYICISYVDILGGEGPCSASFSEAGSATSALTITAPAASTGAVGWRAYGGITSTALAFLLPITSSTCTLTTLEGVMPACAMGSTATFTAIYTNNNIYSPVAQAVTNTNNQVPQSATTFAYQPSTTPGYSFRTHYGPFSTTYVASATASDNTPLASINFPAGFLSWLGRTIRIRGKIQAGATAGGTVGIYADLAWAAGQSSGLGTTVCNPVSAAAAGTVNYTISFECLLTTNAVGTTTSGTIQTDSWFLGGGASGTTQISATEASLTAYTTLNLNLQNTLHFYVVPLTHALTDIQMMNLDVEVVQ